MRYAQIRSMDISNGEGIGVSLFVQGCPYHCKGCFNKETWDFDGGKEWNIETHSAFIGLVSKPYVKRVSILGGEPLVAENVKTVTEILRDIRHIFGDSKTIWIYSGNTFENLIKDDKCCKALTYADVLVDGAFIEEYKDLTLHFRGSKNQRLIDIQKSLKTGEIKLWKNY